MTQISTIMTQDPSGAQLVSFAQSTAEMLVKNNLTRAQIRNIFTEVRKIEALWNSKPEEALRRLNMLKPKLYYQEARNASVKPLREVLSPAIDVVENASTQEERNIRFERFMDLFEAILAYHRVYGGKN